MIALVFIAMSLALVLGWFGRRWMAGACLAVCLALYVGEFLWEVWSPEYGFSMPWLQGSAEPVAPPVEGRA